MRIRSALRRLILVLIAIITSAFLLHSQLSSALVTRGDSLAYVGKRDAALRLYARALSFDRDNGVAADRFAFNAAMSGDTKTLESCIRVASLYLSKLSSDSAVLMDRALCYQHQRLLSAAAADFRRAGNAGADPRAFMFAALDERALHHLREARKLLKAAVVLDPSFIPAQLELTRT